MRNAFIRRVLLTSTATVALLTAPAVAVSSFEVLSAGAYSFTIDEPGTYRLQIGGATGGRSSRGTAGGIGAFFGGTLYLGVGADVSGIVGGNGVVNFSGGGGLSYFLAGTTGAFVGGGGGAWSYGIGFDATGLGGTGAGGLGYVDSGGGAGVNGAGMGSGDGTGGATGPSWAGGTYNGIVAGGFGGGGAGSRFTGGGGGGFSGGNAGVIGQGGQGGTSTFYGAFLTGLITGGTDRRTSPIVGDPGGGFMRLTLVEPAGGASVPLPAPAGLLGLAIAGLIAQARRRGG